MQAQLFCTGLSYCDFVVYTKKITHRAYHTWQLIYEGNCEKSSTFFWNCCVTRAVGRWLSSSSSTNTTSLDTSTSLPEMSTSSSDLKNKYCNCQQEEYRDMVGCDNNSCPYQRFHLICFKLNSLPTSSKWYCPTAVNCKRNNLRTCTYHT